MNIPSDAEAIGIYRRNSCFTSDEYFIIVREALDAKAHLAAVGESGKRFEAANKAKANSMMSQNVT